MERPKGNDIPDKFERRFVDDRLILRTRPSWFAFPGSWLLFALTLIFVYFVGGIFQAILNFFGLSSVTAWLIASLPSLLIPITVVFRRYRWSFELDQQHVRVKKGYLSESDRKIQLVAWVNIDSERSILGRLLNYGDLGFWSGDEKSRLTWWGVSSPAILKRYVESVRDGTAVLPRRDDIANHETPYFDTAGNPIRPSIFDHLIKRLETFVTNVPGPARSGEMLIDQPIGVVWEFLTKTNDFHKTLEGVYWGELDRKTARAGSTFQKGYNLEYYVVNWEPPHRFSMGKRHDSWEYDFRLIEVEKGTHVVYARRFNILGWLPIFQQIVDRTIDALGHEIRPASTFSNVGLAKEVAMRGSFTDPRDSNSYRIVRLRDGNWWLAENLRYEMPGSFPADEKPDEDVLATNPSYDYRKYGRLYTWDAAQKASPPGWHLPSDREWNNMLKLYGGYGDGLGNDKGTEDTKILIRDELDIEFGGFINATDYPSDNPPPPYYYGYFYGRMGGRFWSTARQFPFSNSGGIYYRFFEDTAGRDAENMTKAFSVRCIRD